MTTAGTAADTGRPNAAVPRGRASAAGLVSLTTLARNGVYVP